MTKGTAFAAMMYALSAGMNVTGDYKIPRRGAETTPSSTLSEREKKSRKKKNQARKKARKRNRK